MELDTKKSRIAVIDRNELEEALDAAFSSFTPELHLALKQLLVPMSPKAFGGKMSEIEDTLLSMAENGEPELWREESWEYATDIAIKTMKVKRGSLVIGRKHTTPHTNLITRGSMILFTSDGPILVQAPFEFVAMAGVQKLGLALSDVTFSNVFIDTENLRDGELLTGLISEQSSREVKHLRKMEELSCLSS